MSNNIYTAKETSFWKFIQENEIEIPIIQRDYAQGRLGKESLRKNFLSDLKKALDNEKPYKDKAMKMDFVYGSMEDDKMNPLDGQQRLTTLWLLHWYIALRAGKSDGEVAKTLNKFTYETRISSREFCDNLCNPDHFKKFDGKDIIGFITKQTWFYSAWRQDPTIQSMLRMLGGAKVTDKRKEETRDGIEELFEGTGKDNFEKYWEKLTADNAPILFYHLPLKYFGLSDDLYIKMNARGKQLTSFENFKADLVDYITEQSESELLDEDAKKNWKSLLDERNGIPIKMDTTWTDIFWKNRSVDNKIDEIYFAFLNRFFWDKLFMYKNENNKYILDIGKGDETSTQENNNPSYKYLNNSEEGQYVYDMTISYKELDVYKFFSNEIPYSVFKDLQIILNRYAEIPACTWDDSFKFIPAYENNDGKNIEITDRFGEKTLKLTYLTQVQRVVFHAICKYFKEGDFDAISLNRWMRVVWNLVSGEDGQRPQIRSTSAMRSAMDFIDKLKSHDVYKCLKEFDKQLSNSDFDKRCKEEIDKAKQILDENGDLRKYEGMHKKEDGTTYSTWEEIIIDAENYAFFKGAIRFLFTDANGEINWDNDNFDTKWKNAKNYFDSTGVSGKYQENVLLLRSLLSSIEIGERWFSNKSEFWHDILLNKDYCSAINKLLMTEDIEVDGKCKEGWIKDDVLLSSLFEKNDKWHVLPNWSRHSRTVNALTSYYNRRWENADGNVIVVLDDIRNSLLQQHNDKDIEVFNYPYGWDIQFKYQDVFFQWHFDGYVRMIDNLDDCKPILRDRKRNDDKDNWYCFDVNGVNISDFFIEGLNRLINQYKTDNSKIQ